MPIFPQALPVGTELGNFELRAVLGQGGGGFAYLCHDSLLEREVVLKEHFPQELCRRTANGEVEAREGCEERFEQSLNLFLQEARTLAGLSHPGVVKVLEVQPSHGTAVAVMEPVTGETADAYLARHPNEADVRELLRQMLEILRFLHTHHVIHRDIKPANIVVQENGAPVLLDFGAAHVGDVSGLRTIIGTPAFAAPEQFDIHGDIGPWSDLYALATTFLQALGEQRVRELPRRLRRSLLRAAQPAVAQRFRTAEEWLAALQPTLWERAAYRLVSLGRKVCRSRLLRLFLLLLRVCVGAAILYLAARVLYVQLHPTITVNQWQLDDFEKTRKEQKEWLEHKKLLVQKSFDDRQKQRDFLATLPPPRPSADYPRHLAGQRLIFNQTASLLQWENIPTPLTEQASDEELTSAMMRAMEHPLSSLGLSSTEYPLLDFRTEQDWTCYDRHGTATYRYYEGTPLALLRVNKGEGEQHCYLLWFLETGRGLAAHYPTGSCSVTVWIPFNLVPLPEQHD